MIIKIFTGPSDYDIDAIYNKDISEFIIGVDQGAYLLAQKGMMIDLAIGDFDSVSSSEFEIIKKWSKQVIEFTDKKDYTDTFLALEEALKIKHSEIIIFGGIGARFDHSFANMNLLKKGKIKIISKNEMMYLLKPGTHNIKNNYKYISFFAIEDVFDLSLKGFLYELQNITLVVDNPICISNENEGIVTFKEGLLLVVHQSEKI